MARKLFKAIALLTLTGCRLAVNTPEDGCIYHCSFDNENDVRQNLSRTKVSCIKDLEFTSGIKGNALRVPTGRIPMRVNFANALPVEKGLIEYWAKIEDPSEKTSGETYFLSFNGWYMMHRISTNTGAGTSGWQASLGGFHRYSNRGWGSIPYASLFPSDSDPKAWHHYAFIWNTNGIHGAESKVFQYLVDGKEVLSATTAEYDAKRFAIHMNTCKDLTVGGVDNSATTHTFLIDELNIRTTDVLETSSQTPNRKSDSNTNGNK